MINNLLNINILFYIISQVAVSGRLYDYLHDLWLENQPIGELS